jgi:ubiquinone/menaquinone biosynthesis C-methylase UbiE
VNESFDVVISNFATHEVNIQAQREKLLRQIDRVLRPGGRLAMVDLIFTAEAVRILRAIGIRDAMRSRVGLRSRVGSFFSFWLTAIRNFGVAQTYLVAGTKPAVTAAPNDEA